MRLFRDEGVANRFHGGGKTDSEQWRPDAMQGTLQTTSPAASPTVNRTVPAAWYPDPADSTLVRYWDGVAWTEHRERIRPDGATAIPDNRDSASPDGPCGEVGAGEAKLDRMKFDGSQDLDTLIHKAEAAVADALAVETPAAWHEASQAAVVVSDMARTMHAMSDAQRIAETKDGIAAKAGQEARRATEVATAAKLTADSARQAAKDAAQAAQMAASRAVEAKQTAVRLAKVAPPAAESARAATQAAAAAGEVAQGLDEMVARAHKANTAEAWSEALRVATDAMRTGVAHASHADAHLNGSAVHRVSAHMRADAAANGRGPLVQPPLMTATREDGVR